jgi:hypothetical protein
MGRKCSLQIMKDGRVLKGTAAQLHYISAKGGWDKYHHDLIENVYSKIMKEQNRPFLRIVGKTG